jgi:S-DNA-T family DNA segregation ATPase FtsK/SpoIIIE
MSRKNGNGQSNEPRRIPKAAPPDEPLVRPEVKKELWSLLWLALAVLAGLALFGSAGRVGQFLDDVFSTSFGLNRYLVPVILLVIAGHIVMPERVAFRAPARIGLALFLASWGGLLNLLILKTTESMGDLGLWAGAGGLMGIFVSYPLLILTGYAASIIVSVLLILVSLVLLFNATLTDLWSRLALAGRLRLPFGRKDSDESGEPMDEPLPAFRRKEIEERGGEPAADEAPIINDGLAVQAATAAKRPKMKRIPVPIELLESRNAKPSAGDIQGRMTVIKKTLENFGIPVEMGEVSVGPTVTQFTLKPAEGIKLARITSLSNDLALSLAAHPIRIEAPIPGKSLVGIEVPNHTVAVVGLREILESQQFRSRKTNLTVCLGKDVAGRAWTADLAKMPHMLVAGATGSGKTVCLNSVILSLLYQNSPDDIRLLLIDPKRVELPVYNGLPHLLTPAVTEVPKIINSLKWCIGEMDRRFEILSKTGRRDISAYNASVPAEERIPFIVVIIDELADLMVASASEVEASIIRLAQMARAVGIHLIVATQRPSVDVITGLIKANITSRIAFSVASATDSRTIIDTSGAEKLVGRGDMLFETPELSKPKRIQCCFVSDADIRHVVDHIVSQLEEPVDYEECVTEKQKRGEGAFGFSSGDDDDIDDELLEEAKATILKAGKASASYLQRRLKVGYARAARLLDLLEERGIIGPGDGAKPRQILVSPVHDVDGAHLAENGEEE